MTSTKPFDISKRRVLEAYWQVKANQGAAGIDHESITMFEADLSRNLHKLWNRLASGSYFPPPVRQVKMPKRQGGVRILGVPCVSDRALQRSVAAVLSAIYEQDFLSCSFGGRPGRGAHHALATLGEMLSGVPAMSYVLEADLKNYFGSLDHGILLRFLEERVGPANH